MKHRLFATFVIIIATVLVLGSVASAFAGGITDNQKFRVIKAGQDKVSNVPEAIKQQYRKAPAFYSLLGPNYGYNIFVGQDKFLHQRVVVGFQFWQIVEVPSLKPDVVVTDLTPGGVLMLLMQKKPTFIPVP
jgi:archaellum component FlaG (FlaF/FlaG flagellin family)